MQVFLLVVITRTRNPIISIEKSSKTAIEQAKSYTTVFSNLTGTKAIVHQEMKGGYEYYSEFPKSGIKVCVMEKFIRGIK